MAVETAADRAAFFDTAEHGEAATFTPSGGSGVAVTVIFTRAHALADDLLSGVNAPAHTAMLRASEVATPKPGDALVIGSQTFNVTQADQDPTGDVWTLALAEQ